MSAWLLSLGVSLGLTLLFELGFALLWGVRGQDVLLVTLANVLTNPVVVLTALLCRTYTALPPAAYIAPMEALAVLTEACVYKKGAEHIRRPMLFSLCANALSYGLGLALRAVL